jgi:hypothetical protein
MTAAAPADAVVAAMSPHASWFAAFRDRPRPPDHRLLRPEALPEGASLLDLLISVDRLSLTAANARSELEDNLWMLSEATLLHYLPALLALCVDFFDQLSELAAQLVTELTEPRRDDVIEALDRLERYQRELLGLPPGTVPELRRQQLAWFDSGGPARRYAALTAELTAAETAAIREFLEQLRREQPTAFPLGELERALARRWDHAPRM